MWSTWCKSVIASVLVVAASVQVQAKESVAAPDQLSATTETVALSKLPREAQSTHRLILDGGPFPYDKDGSVFGNRERLLPAKARGYYREYTVRTPGARNRGARRLVCGGKPPTNPDVCYYTSDHYSSFKRVEH
ncbi:ribonuclease domain-containing protein [Roseateles sp.]|uniref:ribonuclease domain-containing protein n=1 Tax=Roseateles sp. TaxID=1971397 RepID=UPI003BA811A1